MIWASLANGFSTCRSRALDLEAELLRVQRRVGREPVHAIDQLVQRVGHHEVFPVLLERLHGRRRALAEQAAFQHRASSCCEVMSGFCSEPERANSFSITDCVRMNHEWSWPVPPQVAQRAERVEAGQGTGPAGGRRCRRTRAATGRGGYGCRGAAR